MAITRPKPEEIVVKLRQVEVLMGQGMPSAEELKEIEVPEIDWTELTSHTKDC